MSHSEIKFKIAKSEECPCYEKDDEFRLSGNAIELRFDNEKTFITNAPGVAITDLIVTWKNDTHFLR